MAFDYSTENTYHTDMQKILFGYFVGNDRASVIAELQQLSRKSKKSCKTLCKEIKVCPDNNPESNELSSSASMVLGFLNIKLKNKHKNEDANIIIRKLYSHCLEQDNLFELIDYLAKSDDSPAEISERARDLKILIHKGNTDGKWLSWLLGLCITSIGSIVYFEYHPDHFHRVINWFKETLPKLINQLEQKLSILKNTVFVGIALQSIYILYSLSGLVFSDALSRKEKGYKILLECVSYALALSGYITMFLTAGLMSPLAAGLFIGGALINAGSELFVEKVFWKDNPKVSMKEESAFEVHAESFTQQVYRERDSKAIRINLGFALLSAVVVVLWCLLSPLSAPVSFACMFANVSIFALNHLWIKHNKEKYANEVQTRLGRLKSELLRDPDNNYSKVFGPHLRGNHEAMQMREQMQEEIKHKDEAIELLKEKSASQQQEISHLESQLAELKASYNTLLKRLETQADNQQPLEINPITVVPVATTEKVSDDFIPTECNVASNEGFWAGWSFWNKRKSETSQKESDIELQDKSTQKRAFE